MEDARAYLLRHLIDQGDYGFLPEGMLETMLDKLIALDEAFMKKTGVEDGEPYDDEAAQQEIFTGMAAAFPDYRMYMMRLTEDYLDYNEEYLDEIGGIDWE